MKRREEFDLVDFKFGIEIVLHGRCVEVFRTRRRWLYMQRRTGGCLHLGTVRKLIDNTDALPRPDSD